MLIGIYHILLNRQGSLSLNWKPCICQEHQRYLDTIIGVLQNV